MRRIAIALFFLAAATGWAAEELPRFFVERIDVQNAHHVSRDVIIAESRLREGHDYTESELREAADRLLRAPYLLSADFSLLKGSERGRYVLVISVNETKPFFYQLGAVFIAPRSPHAHVDTTDLTVASENEIAAGYRVFVGRRGEIHFGIEGASDNRSYTTDYTTYVAGYTQYDIFGSRAFVTLNLTKPTGQFTGHASIEPQFAAGIPLSINQTLTIEFDPTDIDRSTQRASQRIATVRWSYNTTNHPLLPTRGTYVSIAPTAVWHDASGIDFLNTPYLTHDHSFGLDASATRWWEFGDRNSAGAGIAAGIAEIHESGIRDLIALNGSKTGMSSYATVDLTFSHSFWPAERIAAHGDSRLQLDIRGGPRTNRFDVIRADTHVRQVSLSWVRRNSWGLLRIGAGFAW